MFGEKGDVVGGDGSAVTAGPVGVVGPGVTTGGCDCS